MKASTLNNTALRECVARRCGELGTSKRKVLKSVGLSHTWGYYSPRYGHRIDTLERLASALKWTLPELLTAADNKNAVVEDKKTAPRKTRRCVCVACGGKLANPLTCWSPGSGGIAEFPLHLHCLESISAALKARTEIRPRSVTNGAVHTPFGINIAVQNGGSR